LRHAELRLTGKSLPVVLITGKADAEEIER
jgi:hypothetical protein